MKKAVVSALLLAGLVFAQSSAPAVAPAFTPTVAPPELSLRADNLTDVLRKLYSYVQSGQYERGDQSGCETCP